jgi:hypothetical protein
MIYIIYSIISLKKNCQGRWILFLSGPPSRHGTLQPVQVATKSTRAWQCSNMTTARQERLSWMKENMRKVFDARLPYYDMMRTLQSKLGVSICI